jgi:hypothetical protein
VKCFYHHQNDAIALCKSCSRALCIECAADVHPGTACLNRCEQDVAAVNIVIERSRTAYQKTGTAYRRNAVAILMAGVAFLSVGVLPILVKGTYDTAFLAILGLIFLIWSYFSYRSGKQIESA